MRLGLVASVLASLAMGVLSIACASWRSPELTRCRLLFGFLGIGIGLGLSSSAFFVWLSVVGGPTAMFPLAELTLLAGLASVALRAGVARRPRMPREDGSALAPPRTARFLALALWVTVGCAALGFVVESATNPQGGWDAWMTWNMHARAIFRGGNHWPEVLTSLPAWSHPDYPLLVPGSVARIWTYMGGEAVLAPATVAMLFTFGTVGVLYAAVAILRSRTQGALAALLLLGTKFFILDGASQFADIPLAFFFLATLVLLALPAVWPDDRRRLLLLAGLTAGLAAWTKNEGLLFLLVVPVAYGTAVGPTIGWRSSLTDARSFAAGLAPVLVLVLGFKIWMAAPNDLMADHGLRQTAARLLDGARFVEIAGGFWRAFLEVGARGVTGLLLLGYWVVAGPAPQGPGRSAAKTAAIVVLLTLAGYAVVLLTAPTPLLATNIRSINRLLLQVWPSTLLAYFVAVRTAEEAGVFGRPRAGREPPSAVPSGPAIVG